MARKKDNDKDKPKKEDKAAKPAGASRNALARAMEMLERESQTGSALGQAIAEIPAPKLAAGFRELAETPQRTEPSPRTQSLNPITSAADIGRFIRAARRCMELNQQEFADLAGVGRRFISELEGGKPTLEFAKVLQVCAAAGIDLSASTRAS